ncbi:MAG: DEAD/DEAH box helicase family protein [Muribaculaceae bacterium]|nr:DEAD/DEAH box helicase family protein [Muribaculaceae bacterium]
MQQNRILNFNGRWRSYQERILRNLDSHLTDNKLHVVAAPGAGKTTLGIEVMARIGRPALVLCPTNTIKSQWRDRICSSFLKEQDYGIVSTDIRNPGYITVITYQALLAAFCDNDAEDTAETLEPTEDRDESDDNTITSSSRFSEKNAEAVIAILKTAKISLLCFDEAHHLRKEWWKALTYLNEHLKPGQTLALTATPPYDVDAAEWNRYQELCGNIDEVISIPELVKNGDLCPHQDYIYFSFLKQEEREMLSRHTENIKTIIRTIKEDRELLDFLSGMRYLNPTDAEVETIFDDVDFYISVASLLKAAGYKVSSRFLGLFNARQMELPQFNLKRASVFLNGFLFPKNEADFLPMEAKRGEYMNMVHRLGLIANKKIVLGENKKIQRQIASSLGKLDSIVEIVQLEHAQLGEQLRMVVLADYIRIDDTTCSSLGVVPIWMRLRAAFADSISMGVLCGSLILLPERKMEQLRALLADNNIDPDAVSFSRFCDIAGYVRVTPKESLKNRIVQIVTDMFSAGDINVLIGTQALLGEGWDAPCINSLILSSTVSSYMLSNQMRGRAIRVDRNNPGKVSNIWHLATVDSPSLAETFSLVNAAPEDAGALELYTYDLDQLAARFQGYEAPAYTGTHDIRSGIERLLEPPEGMYRNDEEEPFKKTIARVKQLTPELARNRELIRQWWNNALYDGSGNNSMLSTGVNAEKLTIRSLLYTDYKYILSCIGASLSIAGYVFYYLPNGFTFIIFAVVALISLIASIRVLIKYLRTGTVSRVMHQVGMIILETMSNQGLLKTYVNKVGLRVKETDKGKFFVSCSNLPAQENNLFIQALREFLDPIDSPRYLLVSRHELWGFIKQTDYYAIPAIVSPNRKEAEKFGALWEKNIGDCEVVYTRSVEGRKVLLKARKAAFSAMKRKRSKRISKWQ